MSADPDGPRLLNVEVLIVGSGPLGCTFARKLVDGGMRVFMVDVGAQLSPRPGWHLKNSALYQLDVNQFSDVIKGHLHALSIPTDNSTNPTLDPGAFQFNPARYKGYVQGCQNPDQKPYYNIPGASATYAVGGMATHWTAATPRENPEVERSNLLTPEEWETYYKESERLLKTNSELFDDSIRQRLVKKVLTETYPNLKEPYEPQSLPLAGERSERQKNFVTWTGGDTILGDELVKQIQCGHGSKIQLKPMWQCIKLVYSGCPEDGWKVDYAIVKDILQNETYHIHAKVFILAAGAVLTPQILFNSEIQPEALGHYLCIQPKAFCQIVLKQSLIDSIPRKHNPNPLDPIPIPLDDPPPQCWIPVSKERPWHCQIHRDAFAYGEVPPNIDTRLIVDFRWFSKVDPRKENRVFFSTTIKDTFGMPQPTFHFSMTKKERETAHNMMEDMCNAASALGGFLPGSLPTFQPPGSSLHITGTCRMGKEHDGTSVVDTDSKVWKYRNLFLGTCGVIPTGTACNPTNTAMALAIKCCKKILEMNKDKKF